MAKSIRSGMGKQNAKGRRSKMPGSGGRKFPGGDRLGGRERQIMETIYRLGESSVADVLEQLEDAPSYSSVRTMMGILEQKGLLARRSEGVKHLYRPTRPAEQAGKSALKHLVDTFFGGSASVAIAALLDPQTGELTDEDIARLQRIIDQANPPKSTD